MKEVMRTRPQDLQSLVDLIDHTKLTDIVMIEIGCYTGSSTSVFASHPNVKKIYAVDPWENGYDPKDIASFLHPMKEVEKQFDKVMEPYSNKVIKVKKPSKEAFKEFFEGKIEVDLVYVDGNHTPDFVRFDVENYKKLLTARGYMAGHDYKHAFLTDVVDSVMGAKPDKVFLDKSWIYKI